MDLYYVVITNNIIEESNHEFQVIMVTSRKEKIEREQEV